MPHIFRKAFQISGKTDGRRSGKVEDKWAGACRDSRNRRRLLQQNMTVGAAEAKGAYAGPSGKRGFPGLIGRIDIDYGILKIN